MRSPRHRTSGIVREVSACSTVGGGVCASANVV